MQMKHWRNILFTLGSLLTLSVSMAQANAQDSNWETRFNHTLGISFQLPQGYELVPSGVYTYTNGDSYIQFDARPSRRIHNRSLDDACERMADDIPGYDYEIVNGGKMGICLYTSRANRTEYTSLIADDSRYAAGGGRYDYLLISAPHDDLLPLTESIVFEDDVSAPLYLGEALRMVRANFVYGSEVDWDTLIEDALDSVDQFSSLDDAREALSDVFVKLNDISAHNAEVISPEELISSRGYGFEAEQLATDDYLTVTMVYPDSPAGDAGLMVGDLIYTINDRQADRIPESDGRETIRLDVERPGETGRFSLRLTSGFYSTSLPVIGWHLDPQIGYIETYTAGVSGADFDYSYDAQQLIREIDQQGTCGWIVDVRRNPGGQALVMSLALAPLRGDGRWFGLKDIAGDVSWYTYEFDSFPEVTDFYRVDDPYLVETEDPPIAVLVSPYTASMGEMTAYIFRSRKDGATRIFGETTSGYLSDGLRIIPLFDGSIMDVVSDVGITPEGDPLPPFIEPDVVIPTDYSVYGTDDDPVIQAATAWLAEQPECAGQTTTTTTNNTTTPDGTTEMRFVATSGGVVNIRSGPSTNDTILIKLANGTPLEVIDRSDDGEWLYVRFEGGEGWISAALTRPALLQKQ
ncbi:MAG: SH3 domain-containing protein [Chloroflexi bacterium]|nr:SH3 domain-containing protein [Chloroflexota bacterium]MCC6894774.1 SH3 domain-containing protein [Anaerolineae bacterium]